MERAEDVKGILKARQRYLGSSIATTKLLGKVA